MTMLDQSDPPVGGLQVKPPSILQRIGNFEITPKKVPRKELMHFSRQLSVFVTAGIPLMEGLEVLTEEMSNKFFKNILIEISESVRAGSNFADAVGAHPEAFPPYYLGILRAAELTGSLDSALARLADYIERDLEARRKVINALAYPAVILLVGVVTVGVLVGYVLPKFENFFKQFNAKLPLATRILLDISKFFQNYWYLVVGVILIVLLLFVLALRTERGRTLLDRTMLRLPLIGGVVRDAVLERFCRILSAMTDAGVPLPDGLLVTADATSNSVYRQRISLAREAMMRGEGLAAPLAATELFPAAARQMFRVGEDTGTLDAQLASAATYFDRELDYKLKRLTSLFEPAVILTMGAIVGFVAIALISAMYGIFHQVKIG